tara:strand:- start:13275 stop:13754 length:480 start_codon:yes stop_codon:yes gene_type:complete
MRPKSPSPIRKLSGGAVLSLLIALTGCPARSTQTPGAAAVGTATVSSSVSLPPKHALAAVRETRDLEELTARACDPDSPSDLRLASLRRTEALAPSQAVTVAAKLAASSDRLVRENAIALLARSSDPAAEAAIQALPLASRKLAMDLRESFARTQPESE